MAWSERQIETVERARFATSTAGYHPEDAERLRTRALTAMRRGRRLPDLDAMALRRAPKGADAAQVDGLRTTLAVWARTTEIVDQAALEQREREAALAALATPDALPRWSPAQMDLVREKTFSRAGRASVAYEQRDVDEYLDSVVVAMRQGLEIPDPVHARFDSAGFSRGYDPREVDEFLEHLATMRPEG